MPSDYSAIKTRNIGKYGTDVVRYGPRLLADRYDDRTHFIYELLQNTEDALKKRGEWDGNRGVAFELSVGALRVSHFGKLFTEPDVTGICGIDESTKDLTSIGHFGIGFKSVYAITACPEIHSGDEHFAIDSFVWPRAIPAIETKPEQTILSLPIPANDETAFYEIAAGLQRLGPRALLFLRHVDEIAWSVEGGASGFYLRGNAERVADGVRKVTVLGQENGGLASIEETWLIFSRPVRNDEGVEVGFVEVAFALSEEGKAVRAINDSSLIVFFPTIVTTNLGFLVQGPYRTTPSRDNVPRHDKWNQHLVQETSQLLIEALRALRELALLDTNALQSLPLDRSKFGEGTMFAPLFDAVWKALQSEGLLPCFGGGHVPATKALLARTQALREILDRAQLGTLFLPNGQMCWLKEDITLVLTPELRLYLLKELNVPEVVPEAILPKLSKSFLESQNDQWIGRLYEFLNAQPALLRSRTLTDVPFVRLRDGNHVTAFKSGKAQAFLPGPTVTDFPTVRTSVCETEGCRAFLRAVGLTQPDPVDDVVRNVLTKYAGDQVDVDDNTYESDIRRIVTAFQTDSKGQREKLLGTLREVTFVMSVDAGDGSKWIEKPSRVYIATQRLKELFEGVTDVLLVDDDYSCLRGEDVRDLLEACGGTRYLQPEPVPSRFTWQQLSEMRTRSGAANNTGREIVEDFTLRGLEPLFETLAVAQQMEASKKASILWDALCDVQDRRGAGAFSGSYKWFYFQQRTCTFDAAFVKRLNECAWVPDREGVLQRPEFTVFEHTGWKPNPFLLSKLRFKPPAIEALAKEAGIDPGVLDLLKKLGVTSEAALRTRLGMKDEPAVPPEKADPASVADALKKLLGNQPDPTAPAPSPEEPTGTGSSGGGSGQSPSGGVGPTGTGGGSRNGPRPAGTNHGQEVHVSNKSKSEFVSYVATHPEEEDRDPDGLEYEARLALEDNAISLIMEHEPSLLRTPTNNPGFDLIELGIDEQPIRWIEVKAMASDLESRPVGLTRAQFDCSREHGERYWLYVVQFAGIREQAQIVKIHDPAGNSRTFTFDRGWLSVAECVTPLAASTPGESEEE